MLQFLFITASLAATGDPIPTIEDGRLSIQGSIDWTSRLIIAADCEGNCEGVRTPLKGGGVLSLDILKGLGIYGSLWRISDQIKEADYLAQGWAWDIGLKGAIPLNNNWWISAVADYSQGNTRNKALDSTAYWNDLQISALMAWSPDYQASVFFGPNFKPISNLNTYLDNQGLNYNFSERYMIGASFGLELASSKLGTWGSNTNMFFGLELCVGNGSGIASWLGLSF